jgi:hypothetical protein
MTHKLQIEELNKIQTNLAEYLLDQQFNSYGITEDNRYDTEYQKLESLLFELSDSGDFDISEVYIKDGALAAFQHSLSKLTKLETLKISCNDTINKANMLLEVLSKLTNLAVLEINGGILFSGEFNRFKVLLDNLVNLKALILKSTYLDPAKERIGTKQVDHLLVLAMNSKCGLERIIVTSPNVDPADLELFTTAIEIRRNIVDRSKFDLFLMGEHHRAGQDSLVKFLGRDIFETIWKQGSFTLDHIKDSQITRLLQRVDPQKSRQLSLLNNVCDLNKEQRKEIIEHLIEKFVLVAPSPEPKMHSAVASIGTRTINAAR